MKWDLAERFHWTLDYIDALPVARLHEFMQIMDGKYHASKSILKR
jgi:hypothetical protein